MGFQRNRRSLIHPKCTVHCSYTRPSRCYRMDSDDEKQEPPSCLSSLYNEGARLQVLFLLDLAPEWVSPVVEALVVLSKEVPINE
jgi:hypothetical protein